VISTPPTQPQPSTKGGQSEADQGNGSSRTGARRAGIEQTTLAAALGISASALCKMEKGQREHDWTRFDTAHEMIERLERGEPVPVREEASDE
jgi:DNA-binding XRE family transcriptional regulator